ncbi:MAG TPA: phosphoadenylyl-sulfate reductase [Bacteroidales bacterium]|nr:phosphoadenylyl-sulfate reductase [Bacteroidales bacterium]
MESKVKEYNEIFAGLPPNEILQYLLHRHGSKAAFSSSLGAEDQVITHMLVQFYNKCKIFTLDTGRLFQESYDLIERTEARYGIRIDVCFPDKEAVEEMVKSRGINLFFHSVENRKLCCEIRKIFPLKRALKGKKVWITGLRREQSPTRSNLNFAEWDPEFQIIKVNPLLNWTEEQVWNFIREHNVPFNTLHEKGFPSIGCQPCTRAVLPGESIRAGRWWWENPDTKECGLHGRNG